jgi:hypothetical protein
VSASTLRVAVIVGLAVGSIAIACGGPSEAVLACATASEGFHLADNDNAVELCLPPNWRDMAAGDPAWAVVYDQPNTRVERDVADGTIQHFAVPLQPRDEDAAVNLAIYVRDLPAGTTTAVLGDQYEATLADVPNIGTIERADVTLPSGPAVRITATRAHPDQPDRTLEHLVSFSQAHGDRAYTFVFVSSDNTSEQYTPVFDAVARSVRYLEAGGTDPPP